jgi:hypothetical protein
MTRRVFAEDTKVPVSQTRAQIEVLLRKVDARRIVTMDEFLEVVVMFNLDGRLIKLRKEVPGDADDQRRCAIWRALLLVVKAKTEAVAQGITSVEQEWLAHVLLPDGQTVGQWIEPQLRDAYDTGAMPTNPLLLEGPKA